MPTAKKTAKKSFVPKVRTYTPYVPPEPKTKFTTPERQSFTISREGGWNRVHVSDVANSKMWALVQECDIEIGWLSTVSVMENGDFMIEDVYVPEQECTMSTTEITADGEAALIEELLGGADPMSINRLRCWGHSHVNMEVFASAVDESQTEDFIDRYDDLFIRVIANKRGDFMVNVYMLDEGLTLNHPMIVTGEPDPSYIDWAKSEVEQKVSRRVVTYNYAKNYGLDYEAKKVDIATADYWFDCGWIDQSMYDHFVDIADDFDPLNTEVSNTLTDVSESSTIDYSLLKGE